MSTEHGSSESPDRESGLIDTIRNAIDGLSENASVRRVYGDPIEVEGKNIIPVARVGYGFGGGFGSGPETSEDGGEGGGGGGGVKTTPVGVLEVTESETRFIRFGNWKRLSLAVGVGVALGVLLGRR